MATALVRAMVNEGARVAVMKPIASGAQQTEQGLRNEDALALMGAANVEAPYCLVNPYCFEAPIAPHIAAEEQHITMDIEVIRDRFTQLAALSGCVVAEGAGGWLMPVNDHQTIADVAAALRMPVILVVGVRLGCLNHATLTAKSIDASEVAFAGWIASVIDPAMARLEENLTALMRCVGQPPLAVVPYLSPRERAALQLQDTARLLSPQWADRG